jgi:hypothetical protein
MKNTVVKFSATQARKLERTLRRTVRRNQTLKPIGHWMLGKRYEAYLQVGELRERLGTKIAGGGTFRRSSPVNPDNIVWIFGMGRSGNTWLMGMMRDMSNQHTWDEPFVGKLFGDFYNRETVANLSRANFIMGDPIRKGWIKSIRDFVLDGAGYSHPNLGSEDFLVVGEHNGSAGAPLLVEALPESRVIMLVRDPKGRCGLHRGRRQEGWLAVPVARENGHHGG